ncbi:MULTISPECIES: hypothetical protein [Haloarcula]|uniref:hypothetical protein n=1 Tax=Haloarcula TaxID=2237 RepID=UPI0023EDF431|nr:hypothetical protein [Halomicroarcula sp. XH51]
MSRWDSLIPLTDTWELQTKTAEKRVYEHAERVARIELMMDDDLVTQASLYGRRDGEWSQSAHIPSREYVNAESDDHKNELVIHLGHSLSNSISDYPLRESETPENTDGKDVGVVESDDAVVIDNTESTQATLDEILAD